MRDRYVVEFKDGPLGGLSFTTDDKTAFGKLPWNIQAGATYTRSKVSITSLSLLGDKHYLTYEVADD